MLTIVKKNDSYDDITYQLENEDNSTVDLTGASVNFVMGKKNKLITNAKATVTSATSGIVSYQLTQLDTLVSGTFLAEFVVTFANGTIKTYPSNGYITVDVEQNLDTSQANVVVDMIAEKQGEFTSKLNSILLQAGNINMSAMNEYSWTATEGQLIFIFPSSVNYTPSTKWFQVSVGNVPVDNTLVNRSYDNQFALNIDSSNIKAGMTVRAMWVEPITPVVPNSYKIIPQQDLPPVDAGEGDLWFDTSDNTYQGTIFDSLNSQLADRATKVDVGDVTTLQTTSKVVVDAINELKGLSGGVANWVNVTKAPYNADSTGVTDCTTIINNAITSNGATMGVYLPVGTYLISSPIIIPTNALFICEGTIKYTGTGNAIEFRGTYANVKINKILCTSATGGNGVVFNPVSSMVAYNEIYINHIECNGYGIYLDGSTYGSGIQHNKIKFNQLWNCQYGIYLLCNTGWIGENVFDCGRIGIESKVSTIGIYIQDAGTNSITGSKFYHPALEGCTEGILIQSGGSCMIADIRAEESITSNVVRIIGGPKATITSETIYINKIDLTACTGTHVKIKGTILASDGSPIATELRSNSANKRIKLLYRNYANCTTATYTVTDDKPTYYFWTTSATTLNLNQYYGDYGIEDFIVKVRLA
jgi:hypothetical protein